MKVLLEDRRKALGVEWKMQVPKAGAKEDLVPSLVEKVVAVDVANRRHLETKKPDDKLDILYLILFVLSNYKATYRRKGLLPVIIILRWNVCRLEMFTLFPL
uniref:Uncharacterized protein n=1 Tax=Spongospora subterranea TaxID=70186 RepID=A0A0H5QY70_9EUKA|eukprot:CRZ06596.1 hypothetical protein [Spongospora subterranea]